MAIIRFLISLDTFFASSLASSMSMISCVESTCVLISDWRSFINCFLGFGFVCPLVLSMCHCWEYTVLESVLLGFTPTRYAQMMTRVFLFGPSMTSLLHRPNPVESCWGLWHFATHFDAMMQVPPDW